MNDNKPTSEQSSSKREGGSGWSCNDLLSAPYGGFDLDLVHLMPDIVTEFKDDRNLWAFGSRSDHHPGCFVSLTYWNGPGCVLLSNLTDVTLRDRDGWSNWRGHVTRDEILRIPLSEAVRYMWVQCYTAVIDGKSWIVTNTQLHRYHQDILGHVRKYSPTDEYAAKLAFVRDWVRAKMQIGRHCVDCGR